MLLRAVCVHTHNWSLQPFSQDYDLAPHTTHAVCVILYMSGGAYSLKSIPNDRFVRNFL